MQQRITNIVRILNKAFNKSHWDKSRISPFKGVLTQERGWLVVCSDHYTWDGDLRMRKIRAYYSKLNNKPFTLVFDDLELFKNRKIKMIK